MEFRVDGAADVFKGYDDVAFFTASEQVSLCFARRELWHVTKEK